MTFLCTGSRTSREQFEANVKEGRDEHADDRVSGEVGGRPPVSIDEGEETSPRPRCANLCRGWQWARSIRFEGPTGRRDLLDLFDGRRQLIVYRFFFDSGAADWPEGGCRGCSFLADQVAHLAHLNARDTTPRVVSRAPQPDMEHLKTADGGGIPVVHAHGRFRLRLRRGRVARHQRLPARRRRDLPDVLSSTPAATRRWEAPGATSTSPRSDVRRNQEDRPRAIRSLRPYKWWNLHDGVRRWRVSRADRRPRPVGKPRTVRSRSESSEGVGPFRGCVTR